MSIPQDLKLYDAEYRFALVVWEHEPVRSGELARLCAEELREETQQGLQRAFLQRAALVRPRARCGRFFLQKPHQCSFFRQQRLE